MAQFFANNMGYVFLVYGFAFIFMGVSILVRPNTYGLFRITKTIWLLSSFALLHGVNEWLDMAVFIFPSYKILRVTSLIFLTSSFCFLFEFGRRLAGTKASRNGLSRLLRWWLIPAVLAIALIIRYNSGEWLITGQIFSRYFIALPGALLTAVGLAAYRNRADNVEGSQRGKYNKFFKIAELFFMAYAFFAGLVVPKCGIFPANILNTESFLSVVHIPVQVFRAFSVFVVAFSIVGIIRIMAESPKVKEMTEDNDINPDGSGKQKLTAGYLYNNNLIFFISVMTIILLILTIIWTKDSSLRKIHEASLERLNVYDTYLSDKVNHYQTFHKYLAINHFIIESVKHPDKSNTMNETLRQFSETIGSSVIYVINKDGNTILSSNYNTLDSFIGMNYSFRDYFKDAIKGIPGSEVAMGIVSKQPGYYTSYSIRDGDEIIGVVVIKYRIDLFVPRTDRSQELLLAIDKNEVVFYSSDTRYMYHVMDKIPEDILQRLRGRKQYGDEPLLPLPIVNKSEKDGYSFITIRHQSQAHEYTDVEYLKEELHYKGINWHVYLLVDISDIKIDIVKNLMYILLCMTIILAVVIFITYRNKTKLVLMKSYNELLKQQAITDKRIKDGRIVNVALYISLSPDSFEVKLQMVLDMLLIQSRSSFQSKGSIFICDEKAETLQMVVSHNLSREHMSVCSRLPYGRCLCGLAASTKKVVFSNDCNGDEHQIKFKDTTAHGHYCVPIESSTALLGVINIYIKAGYDRNDEDEQFLTSIAHILAGVIQRHKEMQFIEMDRAASVTTLAAGIAHEINNPLSFIKTSISTFKKYLVKVEQFIRHSQLVSTPESLTEEQIKSLQQDKVLDMISMMNNKISSSDRGIGRIMEVVSGLKQFSRLNTAEVADVDINRCIDETLSMLVSENSKVNIIRNYSELPMYPCEPKAINQCFYHILENSIQAVGLDAGNITITTSHKNLVDITYGETIQITIEDDGAGMSADAVKRAFVPFYTTKEVGSGKGLGLSIVDGIVKRHGGTVSIESTEGIGTSVTVILPVGQGEPTPS
ncbi:ATP-binding protein [Candidatus Magnetominusculus dajiuhuensis]|uniref:ATP-binding protein n=1 Tax=Candidatus Magnetominusculus dajiuhuensis TaxID=3137712 RepID=UPI003B435CDC